MTDKIQALLQALKSGAYKEKRKNTEIPLSGFGTIDCFARQVAEEEPLLFENDSFGFHRSTDRRMPPLTGNVTPNYARVITAGFDATRADIRASISSATDEKKRAYGEQMLAYLDICEKISEKYRLCAIEKDNQRLANVLSRIPRKGAESFYEALVFQTLCIYALRLYGVEHLTLGRFDQYMYPFYQHDRANGKSREELFELLEEFFISLNYDTDLYHGVQQGDNGQSLVLGGFDTAGNSMYNELSEACLHASLELSLIDPKINLRVGKNTPDEIYRVGTLLTKKGLGFPQYCNDDVVVPGLIKLGYAPEDAANYSVAACWEYIIPNHGADCPNLGHLDFPHAVNDAITEHLAESETFDALMVHVTEAIRRYADHEVKRREIPGIFPVLPFLSIFMDGCIESLTDMWSGGTKYQNFGCHGEGIANATDALSAIKKTVYDDKTVEKEDLLAALAANFEGHAPLRAKLVAAPKMGSNDDYADEIAATLLRTFADYMNGRPTFYGGIWRAGTGSAMWYRWSGIKCPATADGRYAGEPYSSSFSPSLSVKPSGLLSVISSFTKFDMTEVINGGPLTVEIHDSVLRNEIGVEKVAMLVKSFISLGGHQLQLNAINRERLLEAQAHPEKHPDLIVRVWGWSGYFNELDKAYQDHIIRRCEFMA